MTAQQQYLKKVTHIFDEQTGQYLPVVDKIAESKRISKRASAISFKKSRSTKARKKKPSLPPIPAGGRTGFGIFYQPAFQMNFQRFACLDTGILVPPVAGGNAKSFLYLTATNGTAKGVEALISFRAQRSPEFKIFDWAKPKENRWSLAIPVSKLSNNFTSISLNGLQHSLCRVLNKTEQVAPGRWENKVYLFNFRDNVWDLLYEYQYNATLASQKDPHYGSWGPIVEIFQTSFTTLNPMGFYRAQLFNDAESPKLTTTNSVIRDEPGDGVDVVHIEDHWTFYVT